VSPAVLAAIAAMVVAFARGDLDECARQGERAGPARIERALTSHDRMTALAAISAAPAVEDRAELLPALADVAAGTDRRTAIPAALAARTIARDLGKRALPDDLADDDLAGWRDQWLALAKRNDRWIELRITALDTAAQLAHALDPATPFDASAFANDADPAMRDAAADY
jgi:hypothetical protein